MKVIKPQVIGLLTRPFEFRRKFQLGIAALSFLPISDTAALLPETAMWPFLTEELPPDLALDAVIPKTRAEFLAIAHAHAPGGVPAPVVEVGIQFGRRIKMLHVHGDRQIGRDRPTDPVPFTTMPIDWAHAFGGSGYADNPLGKGAVPVEGTDGRLHELPNVVDPRLAAAGFRLPSSFAPVDQMWPARASLGGTYDDAWLKQDFPGFPRDIDWNFFNLASPDQWLPDPLRGDESFAFRNLHPTQPLLRGRLPGMTPRLFLVRRGHEADGFEEVPLELTTAWFFPHRDRLVLVHHGQAELLEEDGADIARIVLGADRLGEPRPAEAFHAVMVKRMDRENGMLHALRDADLVPAAWLGGSAPPKPSAPTVHQQVSARARRRLEREHAATREALRARGHDPDQAGLPPLPPERPPPTLEELPQMMAGAQAEAEAQRVKAEQDVAAAKAQAARQLAASGVPEAEIERRLNARPKGPPPFSADGFRADMTRQITAMRMLGVLTFKLEAQLADPDFNAQLDQTEASMRRDYRLGAQRQDAADALPAERSAELRRLIRADPPAVRALYDLHGVDLSGLDLAGLDLSDLCLDGANLAGTSFARATLARAVLAHADMTGCVLDGADLTGANLGRAILTGASLRQAMLKDAVLAGAALTGACLAGANLEAADISDAILAGADFSDVHAPGLLAMKQSFCGLHAPGIVLTKARFIECDLRAVDWAGASMEQAVFLKCNLAGIRLGGARMRKTVFVKQCDLTGADLSGADLTEANLRETALPDAALDSAIVERADFSHADLTGASLTRLRAAGSRWVSATLCQADLTGADFSQADLARVDLRGASLVGVSVYEANLPRAMLFRDTPRSGMLTTRMRYLPIYQPPEDPTA